MRSRNGSTSSLTTSTQHLFVMKLDIQDFATGAGKGPEDILGHAGREVSHIRRASVSVVLPEKGALSRGGNGAAFLRGECLWIENPDAVSLVICENLAS